MEQKGYFILNQAEGVQGCGYSNPTVRQRVMDHVQQTCQKIKLLPLGVSEKASQNQMAGYIPDTEVLTRADLPSIHTMLMKSQLRWAGHVVRMPDCRLPKQLMYGELVNGKRAHGGQKKRFKDTLKASLKAFNLDCATWEAKA